MLMINDLPEYIILGNLGENLVRRIEIDVSPWLTDYPDGVFGVSYERPEENGVYWLAENIETDYNRGVLVWIIGEHEVDIEGAGTVVFRMLSGVAEKRSRKIISIVNSGHALIPPLFDVS